MAGRKVAVVTGAGTGVGRAVTLALMKEGYAVVLAGRRKDMLEGVAKEGAQTPGEALAVQTDVADPASIKALFEATKNAYGRLDLLFNNAGIGAPAMPIEEIPYDKWQAVVATNFTGVFLCTQEAIKIMKAQTPRGGRIINNGSISAHTPRPGAAAYTATKHAVTGLTKQTALDCRGTDICCGQIDIGNAATPRNEDTARGRLQASGRVEAEARIDVNDVAKGVLYMAGLPPEANVLFRTVMANKMPYVGRG